MATAAVTDPDIAKQKATKTKKTRPPRRTPKRSLLACILGDPRLTAADKRRIKEAHQDGLTVEDLAALTVYELRLAQRLYEADALSAKDLMIAINKCSSHVAACTQLGAANPSGGANITVTFETASAVTSARPEAKNHGDPDPVVGDLIDAEG